MYTQQSTHKADLNLSDKVFVYGSLKLGCFNSWLLEPDKLITKDVTSDSFVLGDVGYPYAFPASVVPSEYTKLLFPVRGEVFHIGDQETFRSLDTLEGYPSHYDRRIITTKKGYRAWMYYQKDWSLASRCFACNFHDKEKEWSWSDS